MNPPEPGRMQVRGAGDLIAAVPYLLGFHPADSLAVIAMNTTRVTFAMRTDLPARDATRDEISALAAQVAAAVRQQDAITSVVLIGYGIPEQVTPTIDAARHSFAHDGIPVHDALRVTGNRYYSYICANPDCCPPEGTPFNPSTSTIACTATVAGLVALPTRADLAQQVAPITGPARNAMRKATRRAIDRIATDTSQSPALLLRQGRTTVRRALHRYQFDRVLTDDETAWLTVVLQHIPVRDFAWQRCDGRPSHLPLWMDVTRRAEPALVPAPACLLAFTAWRQGNGALAMLAIDRALKADPTYSMALLLAEALHRCIPPTALGTWPPPQLGRQRPGAR